MSPVTTSVALFGRNQSECHVARSSRVSDETVFRRDIDENYKAHAARRDRPLDELSGRAMPDGSPYRAVLREYACPGCGTLLAVDPWLAAIGGDADLWDIHVTVPA